MAYQPPNGGQYPPHPQYANAQYSHGPFPPPNPQGYPQVALPPLPAYPSQQQPNFQHRMNPQTQVYHSPPVQQHPAPPHAASPYGGGDPPPGPYYVPNQAGGQPYAYAQYTAPQLPPQSQPQPQQQPLHAHPPAQAYPQIQTQPPPIRQQSRPATDVQQHPTPQVVIHSPNAQRVQSMPSAPNKLAGREQDNTGHKKLPVDCQLLLLTLADEYLDAAHSQGATLAVSGQQMELEEYFKLIATALGCLEAVLKTKKSKLQPRTEALLRLRYARILYEETNNDYEAETALSKGIDLCDRNKMFDLKYSMQQLLCRIMFKSNPKAATKAVDGIISDVEAYRHTGWEYAFRLLRVTLSLASSSHQDSVAALHHLQKLSSVANQNSDQAISAVSAVMETLVHLQQSSNPESIELAQRSIGAARTHQLDPSIRDIPQLNTLVQMLDICCSLLEYDIGQAIQKLQAMQKGMDQNINDPHWRDDGSFSVPLRGATAAESGDILCLENGNVMLTLTWLPEHDLYALCYFLSSATLSAKNSQDGHKAEKYLSEGLRMVQNSFNQPPSVSESFMSANSRLQWRRILHCNMLLQQIFLACSRTDWESATKTSERLQQAVSEIDDGSGETIQCLAEYSRGIIAQGTGDLKRALAAFRQPIFSLDRSSSKTSRNNPRRDTSILAGLNTVLILREPSQAAHDDALPALSRLEPFCRASPNKYIQAAYSLISATIQTESTIQTKRDLHQALQAAMAVSNSQVTCIALTFMSWKYFRGVIGEQSEKSAKAARAMARKADDKLWMSVTEELLADTLDRQGKAGDAAAARGYADKALESLPTSLTKTKKGG